MAGCGPLLSEWSVCQARVINCQNSELGIFLSGALLSVRFSAMSVRRTIPAWTLTLLALPLMAFFVAGCKPLQVWHRMRADELMKQAQEKLREGSFKEEVRLLKEAANIDPANPQVWGRLCDAYQNTEELDLAIAAGKRQIEIHPNGLDYNSLGLAYMAKKDYPSAVMAFETAVKDSPVDAIYGNLVWALQSTQQYDKAIQAAERGVEVSGPNPVALSQALETLIGALERTQQYDRAIPVAEHLVEVSGKEPALLRRALSALLWAEVSARHYERAIAAAQQLVKVSAGDSTDLNMAFEMLGAVYMKMGQTKKAQEAFAKVPKVNSTQHITTCEIEPGGMSVRCNYSR